MSDAVIDLDDDDDQDEEKLQHGSAAEELKLVEAELKRVWSFHEHSKYLVYAE